MANAIHANLTSGIPSSAEPAASQAKSAAQAITNAAAQSPTTASVDRVMLSAGAQAQQLNQSGQTVSQIAVVLGLSAATVDSYLGITPSTSATAATTGPVIAKAAVDGAKLA